MRKQQQSQKRIFKIFASFLMIFSLLAPGFAAAESSRSNLHDSVNGTQTSAKDKVSKRLLAEFEDKEKIRFLVKFKEQSDPMKIANDEKNSAKSNKLSAQQALFQQRSAVLADLKSVALKSQYNVVEFLEKETERGNVDDFESFYIVNGMAVTATKDIAEKIAAFAEVDKILPNEERQLHEAVVNRDEEAPESTIANVEWNVERVKAPDAWALGIDGTGTVVASLDTGVQWDHPGLKGKYRGYDASTGSVDHTYSWYDSSSGRAVPYDDNGHGTHVTGTMVGGEPNGANQVGVAPGAKWIATKVFNESGSTTDDILLRAGQWIMSPGGDVNMAPDVVNNSWGGGSGLDEWYLPTVRAWRAAEIFPEFSAGNTTLTNPGGPGSVAVPANYPESFATGAVDVNNQVPGFSLRGPSPYGEIKPDITAPGVNIRSTVPGSGYEGGWNGTSMSGPAVAAVAAMLRQVNANITVDEMEQVLLTTTTPLTDSLYPISPNHGYGYGLVDAYEAVSSILEGLGTVNGQVMQDGEDIEAPTYKHSAPAETYSGTDLSLSVFASDNISVTSVQVSYKVNDDWTTVDATRKSGDYRSGDYGVTIPGEDIVGSSFNYKWIIKDYSNNTVESDEYVVEVKAGITTGYFENFESEEPVGWYSMGENDKWEWGAPTSGPGKAYSGENVYATNLSGNYVNGMNNILVMPPVDLPEGPSFFQFKNWHIFEEASSGRAFDFGHVVISKDGVEWTEVQKFQGTSKGWLSTEIDLSEYSGRVYLGFKVYSDVSGLREGWYLDDVALSETSQYSDDTVAPTIYHTAPTEVYSEMDLVLKAQVADNLRISYVKLKYEDTNGEWQEVQATQVSGNNREGQFSARIPGDQVSRDTITYNWEAGDYDGNLVTTDDYVVDVVPGVGLGYFVDFEGDVSSWYSFGANDTWEMGVPTSGPNGAASGENVYATNLSGSYSSNMDATLVMPAIDLPEGEAYLNFKSWHNFEDSIWGQSYDYGRVVVSTDQVNWTSLKMFEGLTSNWTDVSIDLSDYSGQRIYVGFNGQSGGSVNYDGWYIDDVGLSNSPTVTGENVTNKVENIPSTLPLRAQVTILENGRSVITNPADGSYSLRLYAGEYTVEAGAYGFKAAQRIVTVGDGEETIANFKLEELEQGTVAGHVTNKETGTTISEATILLIEDANIEPVETDENGNFTLSAYEGTYTLKVMAQNFHSQEIEITIGSDPIEVNIELDPMYTYPGGEIGYDDGTAENALVFHEGGNGWAVKMSLPEGKNSAIVTDGVFRFWDREWPVPGGTEFAVEVWDAGADGMPSTKLAGPIDGTALRDGTWTTVNLRDQNIVVDGDFYMVYIQTKSNPNAPGLATDQSSASSGRNYQYVGGAFTASPAEEGNYMIRAIVDYEIGKPTITAPDGDFLTNEKNISIEGTASPATTIRLSNNGEEVGTAEIGDDGAFSFTTDLTEGANEFVAVTLVDGDAASSSEKVTVTLDTEAPELTIDSPVDGDITNENTVGVEGTVSDAHLDSVTVNGEEAEIEEDGSYFKRISIEEGANEITVVATDLAGNSETKSVTITVSQDAPVLENLQPSEDITVEAGDEVEISFTSETVGGEASFAIQLPGQKELQSAGDNPMVEVEPGIYEGTWTAPDLAVEDLIVVAKLIDANGKSSTKDASGTITIIPKEVEEPALPGEIDRIFGSDRFQTAIEISRNGWESADTVILARGDNFADALAGVPLAHSVDAPILLTQTKKLTEGVLEEIERLGASIVIVLGGESAVSETVENKLSKANLTVERASGANRFATAAAIANLIAPNGSDEVVIANGMDFPDALSVASHAAQAGTPILLTTTDEIPAETQGALDRLGAKNTIAVGGKTVISEAVEAELPNATRLGGDDRYITNTLIAEHYNVDTDHLYVATGTGYADALTGAALAAKADSAVLLVHAKVPETVSAYITDQEVKDLTIFGGEGAVSAKVFNELNRLID
ncbi:S8 family serine peptidase [Sporosarcina sp. 6E9]|uniref:S8 family serine peptidase n=1 Tax=Sporosarcina sp. 6E9 TaxID=2819235 RepID=UPI001FF0A6B1|nr:S8 family serine peptidase [Sporosarcina sp. 6E9]